MISKEEMCIRDSYYSEFARAEKGAELWRKGDLEGYGQLVFESGKSSIYSYECGCDELKKLYEIMTCLLYTSELIICIFARPAVQTIMLPAKTAAH